MSGGLLKPLVVGGAGHDPIHKIREEREAEEIQQIKELGRSTLNLLYQLVRNFQLYEPDNAVFDRPLEEFDAAVRSLFDEMGEVRIILVEGQPYLSDLRLRLDSTNMATVAFLQGWLTGLNLGGWTFTPAPDAEKLRSFFAQIAKPGGPAMQQADDLRAWLLSNGFEWATPHPPQRFREEGEEILDLDDASLENATLTFEQGMHAMRGFFGMLGRTGVGPVLDARKAVHNLIDIAESDARGPLALNLLRDLDNPLHTHALHVANLAVALGRQLQIPRELLAELGLCALLHDTGFTELPPDLDADADWSDGEVRTREHPVLGFRLQLVARGYHIGRMLRAVVNLEHHLDIGQRGAVAWDDARRPLHPFSRIIAVAEAYDILLTDTDTRAALLPAQATREIWLARGSRFDPMVVQALLNLLGLFPFSSLLELGDGSLAVSVTQRPDAHSFARPRVRVARDGRVLKRGQHLELWRIPPEKLPIRRVCDPRDMDIDLSTVLRSELTDREGADGTPRGSGEPDGVATSE